MRSPLIERLETMTQEDETPPPIHVVFYRACKYSNYEKEDTVTTDDIGAILDKDCSDQNHPLPQRNNVTVYL